MAARDGGTSDVAGQLPTERAPPWYLSPEEIDNSPSRAFFVKKYGSVEAARRKEQECRLTTCAFLQESGQKLRLPQLSIATAIVFYHRFYARESYETYERFQVATTCLFLASKVEETPKKLRDVLSECYKIQHSTVQAPDPDSQELWKLKEQLLICERELLRVLGFDLSVEHAYRPLLAYIKSICGTRDLAQIAWNFINDSLRTTICLQYAPRCLAAAAAKMAANFLEAKLGRPCPLPPHPPNSQEAWHNAFQVREETIDTIIKQIQTMYEESKSGGMALANGGAIAKMMPKGGNDGGGKGGGGGGGGGSVHKVKHEAKQEAKKEVEELSSASKSGDSRPASGGSHKSASGGGGASKGTASGRGPGGDADGGEETAGTGGGSSSSSGVDGDGRTRKAVADADATEETGAPPPSKRPKAEP